MKAKRQEKELVIKFIGKQNTKDPVTGKEIKVPATAPIARTNGSRTIHLPPDEVQKTGFTHEDADFLLKHYPREFKKKTGKGK